MSTISGHYEITRRAIQELAHEYPQVRDLQDFAIDPAYAPPADDAMAQAGHFLGTTPLFDRELIEKGLSVKALGPGLTWFEPAGSIKVQAMCDWVAHPADGAVCQDLQDLESGNHWNDTPDAQAAHFMRASSDGDRGAYDAAIRQIAKNLHDAAWEMYSRRAALGAGWIPHQGRATDGSVSKHLGAAVHCVQDSFSPSHVKRASGDEEHPGAIVKIYVYKQQEDSGLHDALDELWRSRVREDFSVLGRQAINATKMLIRLAVRCSRAPVPSVADWADFKAFCAQWLAPMDGLR